MKRYIPFVFVALAACAPALKAPSDAPRSEFPVVPAAPIAAAPAARPSAETPAAPRTAPAAPPAAAGKPATASASKAPAASAGKAPAPVASKQEGPAPLDLQTLEQQLKETKAIGVMTKLSLKNQVDDLLELFREYYRGRLKTTLAELRRPYEMLLMKVLSVLQDGDPALARAIHASREAIWGILADRDKFAKVGS